MGVEAVAAVAAVVVVVALSMLQRAVVPVLVPLVSGLEVFDPPRRWLASGGGFAILLSLSLVAVLVDSPAQ